MKRLPVSNAVARTEGQVEEAFRKLGQCRVVLPLCYAVS
jgi:hypothetical protein